MDVFTRHGWTAIHWSIVGDLRANDREVMAWAREHQHVVFTHDLDFWTLLALTRATGPSVIQVRSHDVLPDHLEATVITTIREHRSQLQHGAIVTIDECAAECGSCPSIPSSKKDVPAEFDGRFPRRNAVIVSPVLSEHLLRVATSHGELVGG